MSRPARRYSGGEGAAQLRAELDRLFQELLAASETAQRAAGWTPALDVIDTGKSLVILVEAAGLSAADVHVEVEGKTVRIRGRRRLAFSVPGRVRFHCLERQEGRFARQVEVLEPVDFAAARATLEDGLLRVELPKIEERRKRLHVIEVHEPADESVARSGAVAPQADTKATADATATTAADEGEASTTASDPPPRGRGR